MHLGPYEILVEIGRGGMGVVFKARSPRGDLVAIKLLLEQDEHALARFERERRLIASFTARDGFVPLLDAGVCDKGPYMVMPYLPGGTLRGHIDLGPLPVEETLALGRALAAALGRAHERGVVHRDLKPENVLFDAEKKPLIADLGLAKHFDRLAPGASQSRSLSQGGGMYGTPGYMPPEQMDDAKSAGPGADVFAAGAILHECLTGVGPFTGESMVDTVARVATMAPVPVDAARPEVPRWLAAVILRALEKDPKARFADGLALRRALEGPETAPARRRTAVALVTGLALVAAVAIVLVALGPKAAGGASAAAAPTASKSTWTARKPVALTARELSERGYVKGKKGDTKGAIADCTAAIELEPREALLWANRGAARALERDWAGAQADYERSLELDPCFAPAWDGRAATKLKLGDPDGAYADLTRAIELDPRLARSWYNRGVVRCTKGEWRESLPDYDQALALEPDQVDYLYNRGNSRTKTRDLEGAIADYSRALELRPEFVPAWTNRGYARALREDYEGAVADETRALELSPDSPDALVNRGFARSRWQKCDPREAIEDLERFLRLAPEDPRTPGVRQELLTLRAKKAARDAER